MLRRLKLDRTAARVGAIGSDRQVAVVLAIEKLRALVVVVHAQADKLVGMDLARVKRQSLGQKILPVIEDIERNRPLRAAALQAVEKDPGAESVAQVPLLAVPDIGPRSH